MPTVPYRGRECGAWFLYLPERCADLGVSELSLQWASCVEKLFRHHGLFEESEKKFDG